MPDAQPGSPRQRAEAARLRAAAIRKHAEAVRRRAAATHDRYTAMVEGRADRSDRPAAPSSAGPSDSRTLPPETSRMKGIRLRGAEISEEIAGAADTFAAYLEEAAKRGDRERRLGIAKVEREIAGIERRNAARLRGPDDHAPLEPLPELPTAKSTATEEECSG